MASVYSMILAGEIPGRFLWRDDVAAAFLDIRPLTPGHTLVVPLAEVDHWTDLDSATAEHLMGVAHAVANALSASFSYRRIGQMIAGFEVPHTHLHVFGVNSMADFDFASADESADAGELDRIAEVLRAALRSAGHAPIPE